MELFAAAEERLDAHMTGVRALLADAMASVQREHEAVVAALRADNKKLHADLVQSRAREADCEERLARAAGLMSSLQVGSKR